MRSRRALTIVALTLASLSSLPALAHDVRGTALYLDFGQEVVDVELQIPLAQLTLAWQSRCANGPTPCAAPAPDALQTYVAQHLHAVTREGRAFAVSLRSSAVARIDDAEALVVHGSLRAPAGADARFVELRYDAVTERVVTHNVYVFVRHDLRNGLLGEQPELAGLLHYQQRALTLDRTSGSWWRGFRSVFTLGLRHIAGGTDHLLFLLMLLLPASLVARKGRWSSHGNPQRSLRKTAKIVTAFTVGHSLTLLAGATHAIALPARAVEVAIALSIFVSALHALRPLFAGRESLVAGGFGLVHGLAFASVLSGFGFDGRTLAVGLFGFNLGIEVMQLVVVALILPSLMLLTASPRYVLVRRSGAAFGLIASAGWMVERSFSVVTPISTIVEAIAAHGLWLVAGFALLAVFTRWAPGWPRPASPARS